MGDDHGGHAAVTLDTHSAAERRRRSDLALRLNHAARRIDELADRLRRPRRGVEDDDLWVELWDACREHERLLREVRAAVPVPTLPPPRALGTGVHVAVADRERRARRGSATETVEVPPLRDEDIVELRRVGADAAVIRYVDDEATARHEALGPLRRR